MDKYIDTATVNKSKKFYENTFPSDIILAKDDAYTSYELVKNVYRELNIPYRACIISLIDLSFAVQKLTKFSSNTNKVNYEGLVHLLRYIR